MQKVCRITTLLIISVALSYATDSDSSFDLMKYVPPAFSYHQLEVTPNWNLSGQSVDATNQSNYIMIGNRSRLDKYNANYRSSSLGVQGQHSYYGWNGPTEWLIGSELSTFGDFNHSNSLNSDMVKMTPEYSSSNERAGFAHGNIAISASHYFKWPFFIGASVSSVSYGRISNSTNIEKYIDTNTFSSVDSGRYSYSKDTRKEKSYNAWGDVHCRVGFGHIDDISFAIAAQNILDIIGKREKAYKGCSSSSVGDMAAFIEKMKKRRVFDSRIAFVENVDTLCTFIRENHISDEISTCTALEIADEWNYVFYQTRAKGFTIEMYPGLKYTRSSDQTKSTPLLYEQKVGVPYSLKENDNNEIDATCKFSADYNSWKKSNSIEYSANLSAGYERPLSRYFQLSLKGSTAMSINRIWDKEASSMNSEFKEYSFAAPALFLMESAGLGFYPNSRTSITISESADYTRTFDFFDIKRSVDNVNGATANKKLDQRFFHLTFGTYLNYYISPRTEAQLHGSISWDDIYPYTEYLTLSPWDTYNEPISSSKSLRYFFGANVTWKIF